MHLRFLTQWIGLRINGLYWKARGRDIDQGHLETNSSFFPRCGCGLTDAV